MTCAMAAQVLTHPSLVHLGLNVCPLGCTSPTAVHFIAEHCQGCSPLGWMPNTVVWTLTLTESGFMSSAVCAVCHSGRTLYHTCLLTHPSSFLFRNPPTLSTMSSNKSTSINISNIPCFSGHNFQAWKDKMVGVFMISKVYNIIKGETSKLDKAKCPKMPATPPPIVGAIYIMYSRQLLWGILISYRKWNEIYFISFTAKISFLISFLHSVYFIFSKF